MEKRNWILFFTFLTFVIFIFAVALIISSRSYFPSRNSPNLGSILATPVPFDTIEGWQTYQNQSFGYQLQLPPSWQVVPQADNLSVINIIPSDYNPEEEIPITINVSSNSGNMTLNAWIDNIFSPDHPREEIQIGNISWVRVASSLSTYQAVLYFTKHNENIYELYNSVLKGTDGEVFHQLLPTFKFL